MPLPPTTANRLFDVGGPTPTETRARGKANAEAQGALFTLDPEAPEAPEACTVCQATTGCLCQTHGFEAPALTF